MSARRDALAAAIARLREVLKAPESEIPRRPEQNFPHGIVARDRFGYGFCVDLTARFLQATRQPFRFCKHLIGIEIPVFIPKYNPEQSYLASESAAPAREVLEPVPI
jgi:hypothetical protein